MIEQDKVRKFANNTNINPIELTDEIKRKLNFMPANTSKYLHMVQNFRTSLEYTPLDITPLLKPKPILTTHDGVEVFDRDATVWVCSKEGVYFNTKNKNKPNMYCASHDFSNLAYNFLVFSTEAIAQAYLNKVWAENEYNNLLKSTQCQNK